MRAAAERAGRDPEGVSLVAVTKYAPLDAVRELLDSGLVSEVGENKVQDAAAKREALGPLSNRARWRLVGHLQTNKAKKALEVFDSLDSLDSLKLAEALEKALTGTARKVPALVQVKLSDRETQSGVSPEALPELLGALKAYPHLEVLGLMTIAPHLEPLESVRPHFARARGLFERFFSDTPGAVLSMGMSRDFELAVEEGATQVRIGSAIFP